VIATPIEIPETTPQPSTEIIYVPIEVVRIIEVPVLVERTANVCPVEKKPKPHPGPAKPRTTLKPRECK
jgi:hypothetical protein